MKMSTKTLITVFLLLVLGVLSLQKVVKGQVLNSRPIFGVLTQQQYHKSTQYVASSYIKWLEMGGARVVPIFVKRDHAYYKHLFDQLSGVLLPGGSTNLVDSSYAHAASLVLDTAIAKAKVGVHWPVWASCLGFEKLVTYFTGDKNVNWETRCSVENVSLGLNFTMTPSSTRLLKDAGDQVVSLLQTKNVTANYHKICLSVDTFKSTQNLTDHFHLVSTNSYKGVTFVSTLEHKKYPIFATQWHPEKNQFEWVLSKTVGAINHDADAIQIGQYFGNFLVAEGRKNGQHFANETEEANSLIYNYSHLLHYNGKFRNSSFEEIYVWPLAEHHHTV